ncbi:chromosome segregation protein SMC [Clostridium aminobutyricum]|uniref:Chromosome partition protein Smc n=1 Tax=Clostridium aminobutyricum TaxID=33953 RepID=A0A939D6V2_CLOAM|nr:chromosome segregation protein SMC [Clostridium aminobutyricum]MBN7771923.1 chromosome segregation protein SMC [Clostridium aminobutyricum]
MYFKRIDMHGFKSFAEPVSIEFNHGITCIVGPNGSGKSNISDAIRWVLGEQSPKTLRGGKMEDVIFAGTASRKSRGMAEVVLVIDNSTGILPIDYSEVAITRRVFRSGESEYYINNNQCRLKDIRELIMDTGIGVDGYSLIGQGKIADIVSNKTESRREIFEEAAGIVKYSSKKAEAERKLEAANANLERVNDIVGEIESRIGGLKEDSQKATEYLAFRDQYKELEINVTLKSIENIELSNEYLKDDIAELSFEIDELKEKKVVLDKEITESRSRSEALETLSNEARDKLVKSMEEINLLVHDGKLKEEKIASMEKEELRLNSEKEVFAHKLEKEEQNLQELTKSKTQIDLKMAELDQQLKARVKVYTGLLSKQSQVSARIDEDKNSLFQVHNNSSTKKAEINSLENLKSNLDRRKEQLLQEKDSAENQNNDILEVQQSAVKNRDDLKSSLAEITDEIKELRQKHQTAVLNEKDLTKKTEDSRISISQLSARKKTIEEMESNYEGYNYAVKYVMKNSFKGVHGVVADLITVPQGFELAIETALGASMQNIICQSDNDAQHIIASLKANKAGRLTLLPIDSIRSNPYVCDSQIKNTVGFKGLGVDCIDFDRRFKGVMEYLLGRVIIVDTLSNAVKLSKQVSGGLRFVTMEGEVINSGGAITGGAFKNNTANLLERKAEIAALQERLENYSSEKDKLSLELTALRDQIENQYNRLQELEKEHREKELKLLSAENSISVYENSMKELTDGKNKRQREFDNIQQEKDSADQMIAKLTDELESDQAKIEELEARIDENLTAYDQIKDEIEEANEAITKARIDVTSCESEKRNVDTIVGRINLTVQEIKADMEEREHALDKLKADRELLNASGDGGETLIKEKEAARENLERYIEEITEERTNLTHQLNEKTVSRESMEGKITSSQDKKYELEIKKARNETQLDTYKNKLWEEFEVSYLQAIDFKKKEFNMNAAVKEIRELKTKIKALGEVNIGAIKEYESVRERYEFLSGQRSDILQAMDSLKQIIEDMDKTIRIKFKESFDDIVVNFEHVFQELFGGGQAMLRLEDETRPLECGIEIIAQPPGKKLQNLNLMSGGEKTMTAIALMFAVLRSKPTPFCILDEVEAALDDANIERFARYLKNFDNIQFTLVTHQKTTMEHADVLYGVTMPEQGISKVLSLKLGDKIDLN